MTTNSISYQKEFFYFDEQKIVTSNRRRVINPRNITSLIIKMPDDSKVGTNQILTSSYDLEIYPMADIADVFCNIKTIMKWEFEFQANDLASLSFAESLLHNVLNQVHFATTLLRQNFIHDYATSAGLITRPIPSEIYEKIKKQLNYLPDLKLGKDYPFIFSYWY